MAEPRNKTDNSDFEKLVRDYHTDMQKGSLSVRTSRQDVLRHFGKACLSKHRWPAYCAAIKLLCAERASFVAYNHFSSDHIGQLDEEGDLPMREAIDYFIPIVAKRWKTTQSYTVLKLPVGDYSKIYTPDLEDRAACRGSLVLLREKLVLLPSGEAVPAGRRRNSVW
ncbi:hypothetical protein LJR231_005521 [Phyllobacterium sp. LjRoot231]|uniref:hypothetical protein n=1 Tax=Phyllobacterium sp. LjRoot231 TaxID=3342289 RepID=UPI003ED0622B